MIRLGPLACLAVALAPALCLAQSATPYAGLEKRPIKALSEQQIRDLRAGLGMSLALAAELNGYPGPRHSLELAGELQLSDAQRARIEALFGAMTAESIAIGERLIGQEAELDGLFARRTATVESIAAATQAIGLTQAELRATHLKYHLLTVELLTPAQARRYDELRGYGARQEHAPGQHMRQHP
jgi:Spy/CpxP family protein refolding chaperone